MTARFAFSGPELPSAESTKRLEHELVRPRMSTADQSREAFVANIAISESGHVQQLKQRFNLLSLAGTGLLVGNVWPALGGSILVSIYNGGPPGVIYEFLVASFFYFTVAASIAELASAMPSSAGPYLWASVTPGRRLGRTLGFFAGWWNTLAWIFAAASMSSICGNLVVQIYGLYHSSSQPRPWHVFVAYILTTWLSCAVVCVFNRYMPRLNQIGIFIMIAGVITTIMVCATMPSSGAGYATSSTIWKDWSSDIGYPGGFVFVTGMLNGSYAMGTPDSTSHLAEEIPQPAKNVPKAIALQYGIGFFSGLAYVVTILYAVHDYEALSSSGFPIAEIYHQATGNRSGTVGLLMLLLLPTINCVVAVYITAGRTLWALSRDGATPFSSFINRVNERLGLPLNATLLCCALVTALGCIYLGSTTAFGAFTASFVLMSMASYIASILPLLLQRRKGINFGPFCLGKLGFGVNFIACAFMLAWFVIFSFPYSLPTTVQSMNYVSLIWGGLTVCVGLWWLVHASTHYKGVLIPPNQEQTGAENAFGSA